MKLLKNLLMILGGSTVVIGILILRPVPVPDTLDKCTRVTGKVLSVREGGVKDVLLRLETSERLFYINRGLEDGLDLEAMRKALTGKEVTLYYPRYWTPLDPGNAIRHISQLNLGKRVIWTEIRR